MKRCACSEPHDDGFDREPLALILAEHDRTEGSLVPVLQATQAAYGFLPADALRETADALRVPLSTVFGVATFYEQFHLNPRGRHVVRICHGTACHVRGAEEITRVLVSELGVALGQTAEDLSFTVESVACVGCCGLAPVVLTDERTHGSLDAKGARKLARALRKSLEQ